MDPREIKDNLRDKGYTKAARFLMLLGKEEAARVLKHLSASEVESIAYEIARVDRVDEKEAQKILEEFGCLAKSKELVATGGLEQAKKLLLAAVSPQPTPGERLPFVSGASPAL